jgi:hypothetical protein
MKAVWNGTVVAESPDTVVVEGNHYFPADSIRPEFLLPSNTKTMCSWKGQASYHTLFVNGDANPDPRWPLQIPPPVATQTPPGRTGWIMGFGVCLTWLFWISFSSAVWQAKRVRPEARSGSGGQVTDPAGAVHRLDLWAGGLSTAGGSWRRCGAVCVPLPGPVCAAS